MGSPRSSSTFSAADFHVSTSAPGTLGGGASAGVVASCLDADRLQEDTSGVTAKRKSATHRQGLRAVWAPTGISPDTGAIPGPGRAHRPQIVAAQRNGCPERPWRGSCINLKNGGNEPS